MSIPVTYEPSGNQLLNLLPARTRALMLKGMDRVPIEFGEVLVEPGQTIRHVYFPTSGFISLVAQADDHSTLEVGLIGKEGMLGTSLLLGIRESPLRALVQGAGTALRMKTVDFEQALKMHPRFDEDLRRYLYVLVYALARASVCTRFHVLEARLARWLLMTHDCAQADHFQLKHEFLAEMLGVRRSGITIAAGSLQRRQLIHYSRGTIDVLDRAGLEQASCECYRLVAATYEKLIGQARAGRPAQA